MIKTLWRLWSYLWGLAALLVILYGFSVFIAYGPDALITQTYKLSIAAFNEMWELNLHPSSIGGVNVNPKSN